MTYRKNVTYRCNVRRYAARNKIHLVHPVHPVRPARPAFPVEKFISSYNGELWNALDYARFVNSFIKWEHENS